MSTEIWLIRHGETAWNAKKRLQGWVDTPLNDMGRKQALSVQRYFKQHNFAIDHIISSDLQRAIETAEIAFAIPREKLIKFSSIRERSYGLFEGQGWKKIDDQIKARGPEGVEFDLRDPDQEIYKGENLRTFYQRIVDAFNEIAQLYAGKKLAIIAHGGVINMAWHHLNQIDLAKRERHTTLNASINRFSINNNQQWELIEWGHDKHLNLKK